MSEICFGRALATVLAIAGLIWIVFGPFHFVNEKGGQEGKEE